MTQGYNNMSGYQRMLMDTAPKSAEYYADKIARGFTGGKDYIPKQIISKLGQQKPIKGLGGGVGAGLVLLPAWMEWANENIPNVFNGFKPKNDEIFYNYITKGEQPKLEDMPMGDISKIIVRAMNRSKGSDKVESKSSSSNTNKGGNVPPGTTPYDPTEEGYDLTDIPKPGVSSNQVAKANAIADAVKQSSGIQQPIQVQQQTQQPTANEEVIKQYMALLQERNAPYIKALEQYLVNYPKLLGQSGRNDLYFYGANLAKGLNPKAGDKFNQVKNYGDMVALVKEIQDAKNDGVDYSNEVAGNMDVAQTLGLSPQAAYANKNLLSAYSMGERDKVRQAIANANYLTRMYGIDSRAALQLTLQQMRNENALNVARTYMGLTDGVPAVGITQTGQPQSTSVAPVQYPQQTTNTLGDRFKQSVGH